MPDSSYLFRNFLHDAGEYAQAESYWADLWDAVARETGQAGEWKHPWLQTQFGDGTPFRDGNPIFSAVSIPRGLGVRVIQYEPESEEMELDCWVDTFGGDGEPGAVRELVISCALAEETAASARDLIYSWMVTGEVHLLKE
jgi:hypothetical protein